MNIFKPYCVACGEHTWHGYVGIVFMMLIGFTFGVVLFTENERAVQDDKEQDASQEEQTNTVRISNISVGTRTITQEVQKVHGIVFFEGFGSSVVKHGYEGLFCHVGAYKDCTNQVCNENGQTQ